MRSTKGGEELPIVVYTGMDMTKEQERRLNK